MGEFIVVTNGRRGLLAALVTACAAIALMLLPAPARAAFGVTIDAPTDGTTLSDSRAGWETTITDDSGFNTELFCRVDFVLSNCLAQVGLAGRPDELANGAHRVDIFAFDRGSTPNTVHDTANVTVDDDTPPSIAFPVETPGTVFAGVVWITLEVAGAGEVDCKLDSGDYEPCSMGFPWDDPITGLYAPPSVPNGNHTLSVRATDPAGNVAVAPFAFEVDDSTDPTLDIVEPAEGATVMAAPVSPQFDTDEYTPYTDCRLDGASDWTPCLGLIPLDDGPHTLEARAIDSAGNVSAPVTRNFTVLDTTAPTVAITVPGEGDTTDQPVVEWDLGSQPAKVECSLDGAPFESCWPGSDGWTNCCGGNRYLSGLPEGPHVVAVRASDPAGNVTTETVNFTLLDNTAPDATIVFPQPGEVLPATFSLVVAGDSFGCQVQVDGAAAVPCYDSLTAPPGVHTLTVTATDNAGNATVLTRNVEIATPPAGPGSPGAPSSPGGSPPANPTPVPIQLTAKLSKPKLKVKGGKLTLALSGEITGPPGVEACPARVSLLITSGGKQLYNRFVVPKRSGKRCKIGKKLKIKRKQIKRKKLSIKISGSAGLTLGNGTPLAPFSTTRNVKVK